MANRAHRRRQRSAVTHCYLCLQPIVGTEVSVIALDDGRQWVGHRLCLLPIAAKHGLPETWIECDGC